MTLQSTGHNFWPLRLQTTETNGLTLDSSAVTFDSTTDKVAYVGRSPIADSISKVSFYMTTVTTGMTAEIRIETVVNGRPSGTLLGTTTNGTVVIADTDDNSWKTVTLTSPASVSVGTEFAIILIYNSGTTPNLVLRAVSYQTGYYGGKYPMILQDTGAGTWTYLPYPLEMIVEMTTAGVVSLPGLTSQQGNGTITAYNNASSPNEYAMKFVAPVNCRVIGASIAMYNQAAGSDFTISLWPSSSSVDGDALAQTAEDGDYAINTTNDGYVTVFFGPVSLVAGTTYYLGVRPDTANNISVGNIGVNTAITNAIRAMPIGSNTVHKSTRVWTAGTAGAWTDTTTDFPVMSLLIDQYDDGAGGGGGGGMRLAGSGGLASGA